MHSQVIFCSCILNDLTLFILKFTSFDFPGCDSTSAFYNKGKLKPWKVLCEGKYSACFAALGKNFDTPPEVYSGLQEFVCEVFGARNAKEVNEARYQLFVGGCFDGSLLPPNLQCLVKHIDRCNYQVFIWKNCLEKNSCLPSPVSHGWISSNGELDIDWGVGMVAPKELLKVANCHCKTGCRTLVCSCKKSGLECTPVCKCRDCQNPLDIGVSDDDISNSDSSDDDFSD